MIDGISETTGAERQGFISKDEATSTVVAAICRVLAEDVYLKSGGSGRGTTSEHATGGIRPLHYWLAVEELQEQVAHRTLPEVPSPYSHLALSSRG
jgi:hypothetical protein